MREKISTLQTVLFKQKQNLWKFKTIINSLPPASESKGATEYKWKEMSYNFNRILFGSHLCIILVEKIKKKRWKNVISAKRLVSWCVRNMNKYSLTSETNFFLDFIFDFYISALLKLLKLNKIFCHFLTHCIQFSNTQVHTHKQTNTHTHTNTYWSTQAQT